MRHRVNDFTFGLNGFYDRYETKNGIKQFVGGFEILHECGEFRINFYRPRENELAYRAIEGSAFFKLKKIFFGLQKYHLANGQGNEFDGMGLSMKYESEDLHPYIGQRYNGNRFTDNFKFYASVGYRYDGMFGQQFTSNFGLKLSATALPTRKNLPRVERSLFLWGYTTKADNAVMINKNDDINKVINNLPENTLIIVQEDLVLQDSIKLKKGQELLAKGYFSPGKRPIKAKSRVKLEFEKSTEKPLIELESGTTIKELYLDGSNAIGKDNGVVNVRKEVEDITITNCKITTPKGSRNVKGIKFFDEIKKSRIVGNDIAVTATDEHSTGIEFRGGAYGNEIGNNQISTLGNDSSVIIFYDSANENDITGNKFNTLGSTSEGIYFHSSSSNNNIVGNRINISNKDSIGIYFNRSSGNNITGNEIIVLGEKSNGIKFSGYSRDNNVADNKITISKKKVARLIDRIKTPSVSTLIDLPVTILPAIKSTL
ncbi:MAG: hypothetical protein HRK26_02505 [Rickettsiaceae bacterium H1]|nr:hypothetical protein [Rickettsiaceae bacterium H1]